MNFEKIEREYDRKSQVEWQGHYQEHVRSFLLSQISQLHLSTLLSGSKFRNIPVEILITRIGIFFLERQRKEYK